MTIEYQDADGRDQKATYRWLGGIYRTTLGSYINEQGQQIDSYHFRVYWTDVERGEADSNELRMYDGMENLGLIAGNIAPSHRDERVPEKWWREQSIPLLFYERVLNPDGEVLSAAKDAITNMIDVNNNNGLILQHLCQWRSSNASANPAPPERTVFQPSDSQILSMPPRENVNMPAPGSQQTYPASLFDFTPRRQIQTTQQYQPTAPSSSGVVPSSGQQGSAGYVSNDPGYNMQSNEAALAASVYERQRAMVSSAIRSSQAGSSPSLPLIIEDNPTQGLDTQEVIQDMDSQNWLEESRPPFTEYQEHGMPPLPELEALLPENQPEVPELPSLQGGEEIQEANQEQQQENAPVETQTATGEPIMASAEELERFTRELEEASERMTAEYNENFNVSVMQDMTPRSWRYAQEKPQWEYAASTGELVDWIGMLQQYDLERMEEKWKYLEDIPEEHEMWERIQSSQSQASLSLKRKTDDAPAEDRRCDDSRKKYRVGTASPVDGLPTTLEESEEITPQQAPEQDTEFQDPKDSCGLSSLEVPVSGEDPIPGPSENVVHEQRDNGIGSSSASITEVLSIVEHTSAEGQMPAPPPAPPPQAESQQALATERAEADGDDSMPIEAIELEDLDKLFDECEINKF
ncbi:hypothetical protein Plec18170_003414 [Paecilomyces lecythidis]